MKHRVNLHIFDGEGTAQTAVGETTAASGKTAETMDQAQNTNGAGQAPEEGAQRDLSAEFDGIINGEYRREYDKRVQKAVKDRLKGSKEQQKRLTEAEGLLAMVGERYGMDGSDFAALQAALENDKQYLEEEAIEKGMTVEQLAEFKKLERQNKAFQTAQRQAQERAAFEQKFLGWQREAEALAGEYPALNLQEEFDNPDFVRMLDSGVGVKAAYQAVHFDELMSGALHYTAQKTQKAVMDSVRANGARPQENGAAGSAAATGGIDVTKLTKEQRQELAERARRNPDERITFSPFG